MSWLALNFLNLNEHKSVLFCTIVLFGPPDPYSSFGEEPGPFAELRLHKNLAVSFDGNFTLQ